MLQIVNDDNSDTKGVLVKSLSIATTSSMALCALYVSSAKYLLNKLLIPNRFFQQPSNLQKLHYHYFLHISYYHNYNVSAKCKLSETNLLNGILLLCNSDNNIKKSKTKPLWATSTGKYLSC